MSIEILNETPINTTMQALGKDGSSLQNVKNASVGTPGGSFIEMEAGKIAMYDSSGNIVVLLDPNG